MKSSDRNTSDVVPKEHTPEPRELPLCYRFGVCRLQVGHAGIHDAYPNGREQTHEGGNLWDYLGIEHHNANLGKYD